MRVHVCVCVGGDVGMDHVCVFVCLCEGDDGWRSEVSGEPEYAIFLGDFFE